MKATKAILIFKIKNIAFGSSVIAVICYMVASLCSWSFNFLNWNEASLCITILGVLAIFSFAKHITNKIIPELDKAQVYFDAAKAAFNNDEFQEAVSILNQARYYCPGHYYLWDNLMELHLKEAEIYYTNGQEKSKLGDYQAAIADLNIAIQLNPKNNAAYCIRGGCKIKLQDYQGAIADFNRAIQINPKDDVAYCLKGLSMMEDEQGAIASYTKAIEINPKNAEAYHWRGYSKCNIEDYQAAIADYNTCITLEPNCAEAYCNRGLCKIKMGQKDKGLPDLQKASKLGYEDANEFIRQFFNQPE